MPVSSTCMKCNSDLCTVLNVSVQMIYPGSDVQPSGIWYMRLCPECRVSLKNAVKESIRDWWEID